MATLANPPGRYWQVRWECGFRGAIGDWRSFFLSTRAGEKMLRRGGMKKTAASMARGHHLPAWRKRV